MCTCACVCTCACACVYDVHVCSPIPLVCSPEEDISCSAFYLLPYSFDSKSLDEPGARLVTSKPPR